MSFIPYAKQKISPDDLSAVAEILESDYLTQGPAIGQFESSLAELSQARHATAFCNATSALHAACRALDVGVNDLVWTSPNTFVASANCARYCGADIDFVDICPKTYNMSVDLLETKLIQANKDKCLPKVVIPVHFAGQSCGMKKIKALSEEYGFYIIEDASHAIGGSYAGSPIGCCQYSDICIFSFHPVKIITTGEGGAALTNRSDLDDKMRLFRSHGVTRDPKYMDESPHGDWYYQQVDLGHNYRITDFQCALGASQLNRLNNHVERRHFLAVRYNHALEILPIILPVVGDESCSAWHLYVIQIDDTKTNANRKDLFDYLKKQGIGVNVHYIPVHTQPYYKNLGFKEGDFPNAEQYYARAITLPLYPDLQLQQQDYVINTLKAYNW